MKDSNTLISEINYKNLNAGEIISIAENYLNNKNPEKAIQAYQEWINQSESPVLYVILYNLGVILSSQNQQDEAIKIYKTALKLKSDFTQCKINLGLCYERIGLTQDALDIWTNATEDKNIISPENINLKALAYNHLGRLLETQKKYDLAENALRASLAIDPKQKPTLYHWFHIRQKQCKWPKLIELPQIPINQIIRSISPFACLAFEDDPALQMYSSEQFVLEKLHFNVPTFSKKTINYHKKLHIGYLSGDLCMHAVGFLMPEIFELHDQTQFEIFAYDFSREDGSALRSRFKSIKNFKSIANMTDHDAANLINSDNIDILIDLQGITQGARAEILARRPAPIQVTWLGFIGSTMMPYIDYVITDEYCMQNNLSDYFIEKPICLERCFLPTDRKRLINPSPSRQSLGIPEDKFVFASFNNSYKLNAPMFACWMKILHRVPNSILWLIDDNYQATKHLKTEAEKHSIDASRLVFTPRVNPPDYLARMKLVDLFLDNYPYNAGSTASDILWMGVPMITLSGKTFVSRMAGSMLHYCGLDFMITHTHKEYENLAVRLTQQKHLLKNVTSILKAEREKGRAFDMEAFTRHLESKLMEVSALL